MQVKREKDRVFLQRLRGGDYRAFDAQTGAVVPISEIRVGGTTDVVTTSGTLRRVTAWNAVAQRHADLFKAVCGYPALVGA